jgi:hypothetical protein
MRRIGQRAAMAVAAVALGTVAFAGTALACDHGGPHPHRHHVSHNSVSY